ncbi:MAG: glycosyltransferase family 9 protein [candidate division WOR-3 bacterium]
MAIRPIVSLSMTEYLSDPLVPEIAPFVDFYVTDLTKLSQWRSISPFPSTQTWCPLNVYNLSAPREMVPLKRVRARKTGSGKRCDIYCCLGAGDVLVAKSWIPQLRRLHPEAEIRFFVYDLHTSLLADEEDLTVISVRHTALQLDNALLRNSASFVQLQFNSLSATLSPLLSLAIADAWDHFDWRGLVTAMPVEEKTIRFNIPEVFVEAAARAVEKVLEASGGRHEAVVGFHPKASWGKWRLRSLSDWQSEAILRGLSDLGVFTIVLGGQESSHLGKDIPFVMNVAGTLDYQETTALLSKLDLVICVDSVVSWLACVHQRPTLILCGWSPSSWCRKPNKNVAFIEAQDMALIQPRDVIKYVEGKRWKYCHSGTG